MPPASTKNRADRRRFAFVGEHPAIDFANTVVVSSGHLQDLFGSWSDLVEWLSQSGLSTQPSLDLPASRSREALKKVLEVRHAWKEQLAQIVVGKRVSERFLEQLNTLLEVETFHETLQGDSKKGFTLVRTVIQLDAERLALAIFARQIALFLAEANLRYLRRCANTTSCVLYFYDTTKNHRRRWCSVASCGNRHKVAQFRKRQEEAKK